MISWLEVAVSVVNLDTSVGAGMYSWSIYSDVDQPIGEKLTPKLTPFEDTLKQKCIKKNENKI